ncbi:RNA-directed DNA polymerase, eukaryota, reverse transcriptase zinc-binding domain protein [Tanacetum coccineum]|uniref:RNA-directed DNA polymerase, eukaryota, reverse transcriptase zinc-binding domain protein n=1 Tax=Tanacetum coccineum TaxID=301880 RepID=A0ABQ4XBT4_9ASTR
MVIAGGYLILGGGGKLKKGGVWGDIIKIGKEFDSLGLDLSSYFEGVVEDLSRLVEEKILDVERGGQETIWNKLVPKKVNIFVWRVLKGRILVCEELYKRGTDLDLVLCPCCDSVVESCAHSLVICDLAMGVWEKIFTWWKVVNVNSFTIDELFLANGGINVPNLSSRFWQAVIWTTGYYIWKEINARVFGRKF